MSALAQPIRKHTRASLARTLAQLSFGFGIVAGTVQLSTPVSGQTCDRCDSIPALRSGLSSGCESSGQTGKKCSCACQSSWGEKLLNHLDKLGDRVEANSKRSCRCKVCASTNSPSNSGCETNSGTTCRCEPAALITSHSFQQTSPHTQIRQPFVDNSGSAAIGSIGDSQRTNPIPQVTAPPATVTRSKPSDSFDAPRSQSSTPFDAAPEPLVQRIPFEQRTSPAVEHPRIPAVENVSPKLSTPITIPPTPSEPPPILRPIPLKPAIRPPANSVPPRRNESNIPDVLIDPFKDDASVRRTRDQLEGVLLTSDSQLMRQPLRLAPPGGSEAIDSPTTISPLELPPRLTPAQRQVPSSELDAMESVPREDSMVVPSNYVQAFPVIVIRGRTDTKPVDVKPQVSRMKVPTRR